MPEEAKPVQCSVCGATAPRREMFGAEPDLLCEACAEGVRQRTAPSATGRLVNALGSGRAPFTLGVIAVAVVIFFAGRMLSGNPGAWSSWIRHLTILGISAEGFVTATPGEQPWRLVTSAMLHGGIFHILFNLWWIWDLGRAIEWRRGPLVMGLLFVGSALVASALQWMFAGGTDGRPHWPGGIGLSGVVYALAGFLFALRRDDPLAAAIMNPRTTRVLAAWLVLCVVLTEMNVLPIGNWAHGGGAAWGVAAGLATRSRYRYLWLGLLGLATLGIVAMVMRGTVFW